MGINNARIKVRIMEHIKRIDEMNTVGSDEQYLTDFAKRYPEIYVSKDGSYYNETLDHYKHRLEGYGSGSNKSPLNARKNTLDTDINNYINIAKNNKYNGTLNIPEEVLVNFYGMTDNNYHVEVRYEIARYLQQYSPEMYEFVSYFESMLKDDKLKNGRFNTTYLIMDGLMFLKITAIFGDKVANELECCL